MNSKLKRILYSLGIVLLVLFNVLIIVFVYANIVDWKISTLNINPPEYVTDRGFPPITLPPPNNKGQMVTDDTISIELAINYSGTLGEGKLVQVSAYGTYNAYVYPDIDYTAIIWNGASPYGAIGSYTGANIQRLYPSNTHPHHSFTISLSNYLIGDSLSLCWRVEGDYFPSIEVHFKNGTVLSEGLNQDPDYIIHVNSGVILRQENSERMNNSIGIATFSFSLVNGPALGAYILRKMKKI
jgi:hypothetical protein